MNFEFLIPLGFFAALAYSIKAVVDARVRRAIVQANVSQELVRSIIETDETRRRHASLRWGVVLIALALGFGIVDAVGWDNVTPGAIAVLLGATGLGNLAYYLAARRVGA